MLTAAHKSKSTKAFTAMFTLLQVFLVSYVLAMEMVGPDYRVVAGTLCQFYYTFGFFLMALVAYFLNDNWQALQIALTLPTLAFLSYWWIMPESVRWMIRKGRCVCVRNVGHQLFGCFG